MLWKTLDPVRSEHGLPMATLSTCPTLDLVFVPGGAGINPLLEDAEVLAFLRRAAPAARYVVSVCTGAPVLGGAGLLRGRRAATHWMVRDLLRPGGRVAFMSWAAPTENIAWRLLFEAIVANCDLKAADTPPPGGSLRLPEDLLRALNSAGFTESEAKRAHCEWCVATPGSLVEGFRRGTVRTAALIDAQPAAALPLIEAAIAHSVAAYRRADGFAIPIVAFIASGVRG